MESPYQKETEEVWYYTIGCILGEISGELFPLTMQDRSMWANICRQHEEAYQQWKVSQERITESLPVVAMFQEA